MSMLSTLAHSVNADILDDLHNIWLYIADRLTQLRYIHTTQRLARLAWLALRLLSHTLKPFDWH